MAVAEEGGGGGVVVSNNDNNFAAQTEVAYQAAFAAQTAAAALRERWGEQLVTLGTANTHTGQTTRQTPLREYLECELRALRAGACERQACERACERACVVSGRRACERACAWRGG